MTDAITLVLATAFRHSIKAANIEAGYLEFTALAKTELGYDVFCDAIAACVRDGLVHDPVRLPPNALQCHWQLELTPAGVSAARDRERRDLTSSG